MAVREEAPKTLKPVVTPPSPIGGTDAGRPETAVVDIRFLVRAMWRWKWLILAAALAGGFLGYRDLQHFVPVYVAEMIVEPVQDNTLTPATRLASQLGLDASGRGETTEFDRFRVLIGSVALAEVLQRKHKLLQTVYRDSWDPTTQQWIKPSENSFSFEKRIRSVFFQTNWVAPSPVLLAKYLKSIIKIDTVPLAPGFRRISVTHSKRDFALYLLTLVYDEAEEYLRNRDRGENQKRREYVLGQLERTALLDLRTVLLSMLTREEQRAMILKSGLAYTSHVIEPAHASETPSEPSLLRFLLIPALIGAAIVMVLASLVALFRQEGR